MNLARRAFIIAICVMAMAVTGELAVSQVTAVQVSDGSNSAIGPSQSITQQTSSNSTSALSFEVASVRLSPPGGKGSFSMSPWGQGRFTVTNATFTLLIEIAFGVREDQIVGAPGWFGSQMYNINAKVQNDEALTYEQMKPLLQQLLKDRFHLAVHDEMKNSEGYVIEIAKDVPKLQASKGTSGQGQITRDHLLCPNCTLKDLAGMLVIATGRPVEDETGIRGNYDVKLSYAPNDASDSSLPSIFTALQEQLGLKLKPKKLPVRLLAIDHVDKTPTE